MQSNVTQKKENKLLDVIKYFSAILILASHCLPLIPNDSFNFFFGQWFFRFCVPLFIISSGYFFTSFDRGGKVKYLKRIAVLYIIASLLYLPTYIPTDTNDHKYSYLGVSPLMVFKRIDHCSEHSLCHRIRPAHQKNI